MVSELISHCLIIYVMLNSHNICANMLEISELGVECTFHPLGLALFGQKVRLVGLNRAQCAANGAFAPAFVRVPFSLLICE